ncbi:serine hydrolase domain-containing protein [Nonomuraea turkmeniaca]|uniref:serine hydrolase domain-containing protein n=1 Tax=Nonomuraea turkmeniaca TaxID=103838 RepID=UPI001476E6A9|nr:serine hydrolase domain-containing protein [Nonomuraea turkmeniaca]
MSWLRRRIAEAGYRPDEPLVLGLRHRGGPPVFHAQGLTATGETLTATTLVYAASLSKQITAACAALLVRQGVLDLESVLSEWLPRLPAWADTVRLSHLLHHTAALPPDAEVDALIDGDRTSHGVIRALARLPAVQGTPGSEYVYSNAGYVCLASVLERAADQDLPAFARRRLFAPLAMNDTCYWPGPAPAPPGAAPLSPAHPAPLSLGDGGVWTTARDLVRWSQALNADELGISPLLQTPGRLEDGTPIDYAWGMGVRTHAGHRVYRHGGGWPGLRALQARLPELGVNIVLIAIADDTERRGDLFSGLLDEVTSLKGESPGGGPR